jgi:hypothetical protein
MKAATMTPDSNNKAEQALRQYFNLTDQEKESYQKKLIEWGDHGIPPGQTDTWQPLTLEDFLKPRIPPKYILDGIFKETSLNIVYGAPGCMKSFLMQDLAFSVALGKPWLPVAPWQAGGSPIKTLQKAVAWIDFDMGEDLIHERFRAQINYHKITDNLPLKVFTFPTPALNANDPASIGLLSDRIEDAGLVIIDNLGTVSGGVDENTSGMIQVMSNLRWLAEYNKTCIIVIHHQRKGGASVGRAGDALRGHSSIEGAINIALHVDREPYDEKVTIKSTKTRTREVAPFTAQFTYDENKGELTSAAFYSIEPEDNLSNYAIAREINQALNNNPMNQSNLWQAVKEALPDVGKSRIIDKIRLMENKSELIVSPGPRGAKVYSLKHSDLTSLPELTRPYREGENQT